MKPSVVVEADPVSDDAGCVLEAFKAVPVDTLFLQRTDDARDHAALLRAMRGHELLAHAGAPDQRGVEPVGKNQPVVASLHERLQRPPSVPDRVIRGCSSAPPAFVALLDRGRFQQSSSRALQSITSAVKRFAVL